MATSPSETTISGEQKTYSCTVMIEAEIQVTADDEKDAALEAETWVFNDCRLNVTDAWVSDIVEETPAA